MSLIEGIGDEVTHFVVIVLILIIIIIAWITTDIRQSFNGGTVYLLNHRRLGNLTQRLTSYTESTTISEGTVVSDNVINDIAEEMSNQEETDSALELDEGPAEIIRTMDDEANVVRRRRLQYLENHGSDAEEIAYGRVQVETVEEVTDCGSSEEQTTSNITIKLKYLNDDLKIVDGDLKEQLGHFKRRHFEIELSSNKLVRLIFNGQVLQRDNETLQSYGMFDNCVVHCLIHQQRNAPNGESNGGGTTENYSANLSNDNNNTVQRDWDLGNLLIATISFSLSSAWYFRYQYPQLFTVTATVGLVAITGLFSVISFSLYFPETIRVTRIVTTENVDRTVETATT